MKKILYILLSCIIIAGAVVVVMIQKQVDSMDQIKLQYENEVISEHKRALDFEPFNEALEAQKQDQKERVRGLILGKENKEVQASIMAGNLSVEEVVLFYVDRIKTYDAYYNSVIQLNPLALESARALDQRIQGGEEVGELAGLVVLVKDNVAATPMNTSAGAYALKDLTTSRDAFVVKTMREKDAIILGKNNLSEWSNFMSMPSSNGFSVLGGQTKNAYGQFDVGGSSSGPAVAAAMNFGSVTIGSETAGSLIYPAGQNSVVAIKPTLGLLSRDLVVPISEAQDTLGVMGRNVQDVYQLFTASIAVDEHDDKTEMAGIYLNKNVSKSLNKEALNGKRIGLVAGDKDATKILIKDLEALGARVVEIELDDAVDEIDMMSVLLYGIVHDVEAFLNNEAVNSPYKNLGGIHAFNEEDFLRRMPYGDSLHQMALEKEFDKDSIEALIRENKEIAADAIDHALENNDIDVIVSFSNDLSGVYAPAGYPALTVPAGYSNTGEPYGVTFVASALEDRKLFNVAYAFEQGTKYRKTGQILGWHKKGE